VRGVMNEGDVEVVIGLLGGRPDEDWRKERKKEEVRQVYVESEDEDEEEEQREMERAAARERKRRSIARPCRNATEEPGVSVGASNAATENLYEIPEPVRPFGQQYRLQAPQQDHPSSNARQRMSRWGPELSPLHGQSAESPATEQYPASPQTLGSATYASSSSNTLGPDDGTEAESSTIPHTYASGGSPTLHHVIRHLDQHPLMSLAVVTAPTAISNSHYMNSGRNRVGTRRS
jgi:hypothetical protein